ncbi:MAG TPA: hypothetical protein VGH28_29580 [Polyangiaceae bacterium]|jgi:ActR/RegA family two-component response regulator
MKVMLVTQHDEVRRVVEEVLGGEDEVLAASDLASGLGISVEHSPPLAIVDVSLAGGAALAMVHHVMASSPKTAIYVLAAPGSFEVAAEALSLGAAGLLVAPATGDAILRAVAEIRARTAIEERMQKLATDVRDATELLDALTHALVVAKGGDPCALGETLLTLFLIASGAHGVAVYGEENSQDGTRRRIAAYGTSLELLDRYNDLELAQIATARKGEIIGLAVEARMFGCVLLERPDPMRTARVHRVIDFATALLPLCAMAKTAIAEDATAPRSRALPPQVLERLVQREAESAQPGREVSILCAVAKGGEVDTGPLGPALALPGAAIGKGEGGDAFVLLPKTALAASRSLLLDVALPVGLATAPADGRSAAILLRTALARAVRASKAPGMARALRDRPLADVIASIATTKHPGVVSVDVARDALESILLHACRHAAVVGGADVVMAHAGDVPGALANVRQAAGSRSQVRAIKLPGAAHAGTLVVLVLTPRAGWGMITRERDGRTTAVHTSDATLLELLRARLSEAP